MSPKAMTSRWEMPCSAAKCSSVRALVSPRCYKIAWKFSDAVDYIRQGAGRNFDPTLVQLFLANLPSIEEIYRTYPDNP